MANPNRPEVPPQPPHRSAGDTGTPQRGRNTGDAEEVERDDPRQAAEEGEPKESQRSHGHVIDENGAAKGKIDDDDHADKNEHWESGRHHAD